MEPLNLYRDIPNIVRTCPDFDLWQVVELVCEKTGRSYLDSEDTQTLKAIFVRSKISDQLCNEPQEPEDLEW